MMYEMKYLIHRIHEECAEEALLLSPRSFKRAADAEPSFAWSDGRKGVMLSFSSAVRCGLSIQDRVRFYPFPILSNIYCPIFCLVTSIEFKGLWAWSTEYLFKTIKLNFYLWQIWSLSTCPHYSVLKTPNLSINKLGYLVYWHTIVLSQVTHPLLIYQFGDGTELMLLAKSYSSSTSSAPCSFHILQKSYISPEFLWFWSLTTCLCNLPTFFD